MLLKNYFPMQLRKCYTSHRTLLEASSSEEALLPLVGLSSSPNFNPHPDPHSALCGPWKQTNLPLLRQVTSLRRNGRLNCVTSRIPSCIKMLSLPGKVLGCFLNSFILIAP